MRETSEQARHSASFRGAVAPAALLAVLVAVFLGDALVPPAGAMLAGLDARALFYPWLTTWREAVLESRLPLWDPAHFSGVPFLANPQVAAWYPPTWLALVLPVSLTLSLYAALHLWLAGTGMLVLARQLYGDRGAAFAAAVTFTFSGFMAARLYGGHLGVMAAYAWVPWTLAATNWAVRDGRPARGIVAGVPLGVAVLAGHVPSLLYVVVIWIGFALTLASRKEYGVRRVARQVAISALVGVALSAVQLIPFAELAWHSTRATGLPDRVYAMPLRHFITLLVPDFFGDPVRMHYWSTANFEEYFYGVGVLPLLALPLAWRARVPFGRYCLVLMGAGLVLSPGPHSLIYTWFAAALPVIRFDRAPVRAMVLFTFGGCLLLAGAIAATRRSPVDAAARRRLLARTAVVLTALALAGGLYTAMTLPDALTPAVREMRSIRLLGWSRVLAATLGLATTWYWMVGRRPARLTLALLGTLIVADLWTFGRRLVRVEMIEPAPVWRDAASIIGEPYARVLPWRISFVDENDGPLVGLTSTSGYNTLELASYRTMTGDADPRAAIYDVAAAQYVISDKPLEGATEGDRALQLVDHTAATWVYRRPHALDQTRLVYDLEVIASPSHARARLADPSFNPDRTAIVADPVGCRPGPIPSTSGHVVVLAHTGDRWEIATRSTTSAVLVIADNAYPGWEVTIDGVRSLPILVYSTFKGVCVPAGDHTVVWRFRPVTPVWGGAVSLTAIIFVVVAAVRSRRK